MENTEKFTIKQASEWASRFLKRNVSPSNISYLIQYGRIKKIQNNGDTFVSKQDLINYYKSHLGKRETRWTKVLGEDINWELSFDYLKESERTKHVHRLHPYKGKFIPQLVEYFLDSHTDQYKREVYFQQKDIILDPFCGSGTTLVQTNELRMHAVGIDVSPFNALISNAKVAKYDLFELHNHIKNITVSIKEFSAASKILEFELKLLEALADFNKKYFPSPEFKIKVNSGEINETEYGRTKEREFAHIYKALLTIYGIEPRQNNNSSNFLDEWYTKHVREEIELIYTLIESIQEKSIKTALTLILSRTIRSCRATTHFDLATLKEPVYNTYYCHKHGKICKPIFSLIGWWSRYGEDTLKRLAQFDKLRTDTYQCCLTGDSRNIDIVNGVKSINRKFGEIIQNKGIKGIFSSPPYVGLIDYHNQHAYAYDLFKFPRNDEFEIGKLSLGQGAEARQLYIQSISEVLIHCTKYLSPNYDVFLVANDKFGIYPIIAEKSGMKIVQRYHRPVLNRTERDKAAYSETIFHLKEA